MGTILVVVGFIILVTGHQSSWLLVGAIGFIIGSLAAQEYKLVHNENELILFSLTCSMLGGLLTAYFRKPMVILAAFFAGGYTCFFLPNLLGWETAWLNWIAVLITATFCAMIELVWGALPVILISSLLGSTLVIQNMRFGSVSSTDLFIVLISFGIVSQWILWHYSQSDIE
jgi:hypothetical protein